MGRTDEPAGADVIEDGRPRSRRLLPGLVTIFALAVAATVVWVDVLRSETPVDRVRCPRAPEAAHLTPVPQDTLRAVTPAPPGRVAVLVRNSTDRQGLATRAAARLELLGFAEAAPPDNDPVYPTDTMECVGQIRFGADGRAAARTIRLVAPCAQLVRDDNRTDGVVHLVLGTHFTTLTPTSEARDALRTLRAGEDDPAAHAGGLQSMSGTATSAPLPAPAQPPVC
ncbi:envelope integrity protein Cei [Actinophytocola glycyrrhizae]|uniref:Envelope integrity protein Cei n=1 Tax=Actinophytocola glycyrrhizae TaxID=2044873 RepID=A0ABV9RUS3_9PSEU